MSVRKGTKERIKICVTRACVHTCHALHKVAFAPVHEGLSRHIHGVWITCPMHPTMCGLLGSVTLLDTPVCREGRITGPYLAQLVGAARDLLMDLGPMVVSNGPRCSMGSKVPQGWLMGL